MATTSSNTSIAAKAPIIIIGAGLGGLTLAQGLRKRQIPYRVFERDPSPEAREQGWAVALHWIIPDLQRNFLDDLPPIETISHLYDQGLPSEGAIFKGKTCEEVSRFSAPDGKSFVRVARPKCREWLSTHIDIEWGKQLERLDTHDSGVTAHFSDGSSAEGCMLIGADGGHSQVRELLLGRDKAKLHVHPMDVYVGMTTVSRGHYEYQFRNFARSLYVVEAPNSHLFTGLRTIAADGETADYYWMVFRHLTDAEQQMKDRSIDKWSNKDILAAAKKTIEEINPRFTEIVWLTKPEEIYRPALFMEDFLPPVEGFGGKFATVLGDAAHKMTPFKGEGGNHAMKDAIDLLELLDSGINDIPTLIKQYEKVIMIRGIEAVEKTRAAAMDWVNLSVKGDWQDKVGKS